ncbi:hypothetical protein pb186bvf_016799 [Paramecium bursaria]
MLAQLQKNQLINSSKNQYKVIQLIGQGTYGDVYLGQDTKSLQYYAIKQQSKMSESEMSILHEFMGKKFKNIVNTVDFFQINNLYYTVMEYCDRNLYELIQNRPITVLQFKYIVGEIANGVQEIHNMGIIHRDIKPENILLFTSKDEQGISFETYKICDFGFSKAAQQTNTENKGSPYYISPEQLRKQPHDQKVDIWALGCVMFEMLTGHTLFRGNTYTEIFESILNKDVIPEICSIPQLQRSYKELITKMVTKDPTKRPTIQQVIDEIRGQKTSVLSRTPSPLLNKLTIQSTFLKHQMTEKKDQQLIGQNRFDLIKQNFQKTTDGQVNKSRNTTPQQSQSMEIQIWTEDAVKLFKQQGIDVSQKDAILKQKDQLVDLIIQYSPARPIQHFSVRSQDKINGQKSTLDLESLIKSLQQNQIQSHQIFNQAFQQIYLNIKTGYQEQEQQFNNLKSLINAEIQKKMSEIQIQLDDYYAEIYKFRNKLFSIDITEQEQFFEFFKNKTDHIKQLQTIQNIEKIIQYSLGKLNDQLKALIL